MTLRNNAFWNHSYIIEEVESVFAPLFFCIKASKSLRELEVPRPVSVTYITTVSNQKKDAGFQQNHVIWPTRLFPCLRALCWNT